MRKRLGSKRKELSLEHIAEITRLFGNFEEAEQDGKPISRIFRTEDFGYRTISVERPLRDQAGRRLRQNWPRDERGSAVDGWQLIDNGGDAPVLFAEGRNR